MPLGVTLLALFVCYASARRSGLATWSAYAAGVGTYTLVTVLLALRHRGRGRRTCARAFVGGARGLRDRSGRRAARPPRGALAPRDSPGPSGPACPAPLRTGAAGGLLASAALVLVAALVTALWVLAGRATIGDVVRGLGLDAVGGVVLAVAELAYLPNLVVWALAWLTRRRASRSVRGRTSRPTTSSAVRCPRCRCSARSRPPTSRDPATSLVPLVLVGGRRPRRARTSTGG